MNVRNCFLVLFQWEKQEKQSEQNIIQKEKTESFSFYVGQRVEANYKEEGDFYPGKIVNIIEEELFDVDYDDGDQDRNLKKIAANGEINIRPLTDSA